MCEFRLGVIYVLRMVACFMDCEFIRWILDMTNEWWITQLEFTGADKLNDT